MKRAFTLVEILIMVAILGILAAIAIPQIQNYADQAKAAAAKDNLRILRNAIERYAAMNNGIPPGYADNDPAMGCTSPQFYIQMISDNQYLSGKPRNPFNKIARIRMVINGQVFPTEPEDTSTWGWIYKPEIKEIRLNWLGIDSDGKAYFEY